MGLIKYDDASLLDTKNRIDTCNEQMINALEKISIEFNDMNSTISTPKFNSILPTFLDYYNEKLDFMKNSKDSFNTIIDTISTDYNEYLNTVKEMVGGNNGNK